MHKKIDLFNENSDWCKECIENLLDFSINSTVYKDVYKRLLNNMEKVPIEELEELVDKYC